MRTFAFLLVFVLVLRGSALAAADAGTTTVKRITDQVIAGQHPLEFTAINRALADNKGREAADIALALVAKARVNPERTQGTPAGRDAADSTYWAAWRVCLQVRKAVDESDAKKPVLDEWIKRLPNDVDDVKWQLYALADVWDRDFLAGEFWQLLHRVENRRALSAICFLLFARGDHADVAFLKEKRKLTSHPQDQSVLDRTIAWLDYKHQGRDKGDSVPSSPPPGIE